MAKIATCKGIPILGSAAAAAAKEQMTPVWGYIYGDPARITLNPTDTKSLNIQRQFG
jgi:hypothetical protein|nr:hypothetical protein [Desulfohalobium retbaense]